MSVILLTDREVELLLWKVLVDDGGSMTIPPVKDLPDRRVLFLRRDRYVECVAEGTE